LPESIDTMLDRWLACVARLESEIPAQQFKPWIKPLVFLGYDEGEHLLRLGVPNHFKLNWVKSQFESRIETIARETIEPELRVSFICSGSSTSLFSAASKLCSPQSLAATCPSSQ